MVCLQICPPLRPSREDGPFFPCSEPVFANDRLHHLGQRSPVAQFRPANTRFEQRAPKNRIPRPAFHFMRQCHFLSACTLLALTLTAHAESPELARALSQQAEAEALHQSAEKERAAADRAQESGLLACNAKFLVNRCRQKVRADYIERISQVREMEIRANAMEREARTNELTIRDQEREKSHAVPAPESSAASSRRPAISPRVELQPKAEEVRPPRHDQPAPAPISAKAAAAEKAGRERAQAAAEHRRAAENQAAAARAARAREDAARYDARAKAHQEKKKDKAEAPPAPLPGKD